MKVEESNFEMKYNFAFKKKRCSTGSLEEKDDLETLEVDRAF